MSDAAEDGRPTSLGECLKDGRLVPHLYCEFLDREDDEADARRARRAAKAAAAPRAPPPKKRRASPTKSNFMRYDAETGQYVPMRPEDSVWYTLYVQNYPQSPKQLAKFRRRFRMPYQKYLELLEDAKNGGWFPRAERPNCANKMGVPLSLLILGALRYLGRGWTFDDLEEATAISEETHRRFFHQFITVGSTVLFDKWVVAPRTAEEAAEHTAEYEEAGLPGCIGSSDGTHIVAEKVQARLKNAHLGAKESHTARAYNLTCNHRRWILNTTRGCPSSFNDQNMQVTDSLLVALYRGDVLSDVEFVLLDYDSDMRVVEVRYSGPYTITDNGYLPWPVTVPPEKWPYTYWMAVWSKWVESLRKDVECCFGIMKGRFRILKTGIRLHGVDVVDKIWATCCALHNMLLGAGGLDGRWEEGVESPWAGELGEHDAADVPLIFRRAVGSRACDLSGMGSGGDVSAGGVQFGLGSGAGGGGGGGGGNAVPVRGMRLGDFRKKLITHFSIKWGRHEVKWPSRNGVMDG